jgi:hypothetical protein
MALDAGDPSLEGSVYRQAEPEFAQCQWCDERSALLAAHGAAEGRAKPTTSDERKQMNTATKTVSTMVLPNIQAMMTGVWRIDRAHALVKLTYTDGTVEAANVTNEKWNEISGNPFAIVGYVQSVRKG